MIPDSGFKGQPSRFNSRFEAGASISATDLNGLATGLQATTAQFYLGDGPSVSIGSGGVQIVDNRDNDAPGKKAPWTVQVYQDNSGEGGAKWILRMARGVCNYTWSEFPFSPKTTTSGAGLPILNLNGNKVYHNECIVTDYAVYPESSYKEGTDSLSQWMGGNAGIQIKNAADGGADEWYVTVSKLDWWNKFSWDDGARLQNVERPWVSVFAAGSAAYTKILKPTQNSLSLHRLYLPQPGVPVVPMTTDFYQGNVVAKHIGYDVKKIAALNWDSVKKRWDIYQYMTDHIHLEIPYQEQTIWDYFIYQNSPPNNDYQVAVDANFVGYIDNLTMRSDLATIAGYTIEGTTNWWHDVVTYTTAR